MGAGWSVEQLFPSAAEPFFQARELSAQTFRTFAAITMAGLAATRIFSAVAPSTLTGVPAKNGSGRSGR